MFEKLSIIEPVGLIPSARNRLNSFSKEIIEFEDVPSSDSEIIRRIGDAEAVLLSYTSQLSKEILAQCPHLKYVGMCNSLYSVESANVDILYAEKNGITVKGIRDYGDEGVVEYVLWQLVSRLHGFGTNDRGEKISPWKGAPEEVTGLKCGIIGLGKSGGMIADALAFLGAEISYYSRTRKEGMEQEKGYRYQDLPVLLAENEILFCCLNRNTVLLYEKEFKALGSPKILFNTGLSPAWELEALQHWLATSSSNLLFCDSLEALGDKQLLNHPQVGCQQISSGRTRQAFIRLSEKVLKNIEEYLSQKS